MERTARVEAETYDDASWAAIAIILVMVGLCQAVDPLPLDPLSTASLVAVSAALGGAATFYRKVRRNERFAVMCIALLQVILFSAIGSILSYLLARNGGGLWDARLAQWDAALGFDWSTYVGFVDSSPILAGASAFAYRSLIPQMIVLVLALGFFDRLRALRAVMLAAITCGTVTVILSTFFPAVGNVVHYGLGPDDFRYVDPLFGTLYLADYTALRDGTYDMLRLSSMQGIITFPSYHSGLSVVTLWGFWLTRIWWLRWPGMALALATIAATPVDGAHYLVDVIAGAAIAVPSIFAARRLVGWKFDRFALRASPSPRSRLASGR